MEISRTCLHSTLLFTLLLAIFLLPGLAAATPNVTINIEGIEDARRANVLASLRLAQSVTPLEEGDVQRLHETAPDEIRIALQPFGYYQPVIRTDLSRNQQDWKATYQIDPGPALKVVALDLRLEGEATNDQEFTDLLAAFPLMQGQTLIHADYERGKTALQALAAGRGYVDAAFTTSQIVVDLQNYSARVLLHFASGARYQFGTVSFEQEGFSESFLRRFVPFKEGDPYVASEVATLQNALTDSDYFERVEVTPRRDLVARGRLPIAVVLTPKKQNKYTAGIGYGTDTGVRGSLAWERRRINSLGHRADLSLGLSQLNQSLTARYRIPLANPLTDQLVFGAGYLNEETDTSISQLATLSGIRTRVRGNWTNTLGLSFQHEESDIGGEQVSSDLLIPAIGWVHLLTDSSVYATRGSRLQLDLRGAVEPVLSDTSFLQARARAKVIRSLGSSNRFIVRGDAGYTQVDNISTLPASLRFFAGGDQSVRGYSFESLGPLNDQGEVSGGKFLLVASAEYERRLTEKWGAAVFIDTGNAFNSFSDPLRGSVGFGVRWQSPVGQVRLDLGVPLTEAPDAVRLHLTIGPDF